MPDNDPAENQIAEANMATVRELIEKNEKLYQEILRIRSDLNQQIKVDSGKASEPLRTKVAWLTPA
jgi:hypothetical protein